MSEAAYDLAIRFHEAYERLAPKYGYETRDETRLFDATSANGRLMIAVCSELLKELLEASKEFIRANDAADEVNDVEEILAYLAARRKLQAVIANATKGEA